MYTLKIMIRVQLLNLKTEYNPPDSKATVPGLYNPAEKFPICNYRSYFETIEVSVPPNETIGYIRFRISSKVDLKLELWGLYDGERLYGDWEQAPNDGRLLKVGSRYNQKQSSVYNILLKKFLTPEERDIFMDAYIQLYPKARSWTDAKWERRFANFPLFALKYVRLIVPNVNDYDLKKIVMDLKEDHTQRQKIDKDSLWEQTARTERTNARMLTSINRQKQKDCFRLPEVDPFADHDVIVMVDTNLDPLSSQFIFSKEMQEPLFEALGPGNPVISLETQDFRRVYGRIYDFSDCLQVNEVVVSIGAFIQLGGKEPEIRIPATINMCLLMFPIQRLELTYIGTETVKDLFYNFIVETIETRITNDRMPGISQGMEIPLKPGITVRVTGIYMASGEQIFAGGLLNRENVLLFTLKSSLV